MRHNFLKSTAIVALVFFSWTFGGLFDVAYAVKNSQELGVGSQESNSNGNSRKANSSNNQPSAFSNQQIDKKQKTEEKLQKAVEDIENTLADTVADTDTKKARLKAKKTEIETHDIEIRKEFAETEKKLKDSKLPDEILQRHYKFVKNYEDNLRELNANLNDIDKAKDKAEIEAKTEKIRKHLGKVKPLKRHQPLDPNKLPHRSPEVQKKEPRLKYDSDQQSAISFQPKTNPQSLKPKHVLLAANGPISGLFSQNSEYRIQNPESTTPNSQLLALNSQNLPSSTDLAETIEVQFTPEIQAKATELNNNPVKIYNWVRNNIEYVPTYGSIQGANMCLQTKQCNDFDTASLLIALLRASNIPAKYVYGTIELTIEKVMNWVGGFTDANAALELISSGGIPVKGITMGGKLASVRMEHVWVEAYVDYIPSRGAVNIQGDTWIPLDASYKQYMYKQGLDMLAITSFDAQSFANAITANSTIDPVTGSIKNVPVGDIQSQLNSLINTMKTHIETNMPDATVGDVLGSKDIVQQDYKILPVSLAYKTVVTGNKFSQIADNYRHKITIAIENPYDPYGDSQPLNYNISLPQIAFKKLTLAYMPATAADEQTLTAYGYYNVRPYLVKLKPVLYIDGVAVAQGGIIGMGEAQTISVSFALPDGSIDNVTHPIVASTFASIGLDMQKVPGDLLTKAKTKLDIAVNQLGVQDVAVDSIIGETLNLHSLAYFAQVEMFNRMATRGKVAYIKQTAEMLSTLSPNISYFYGMPYSITGLAMGVDVKRYVMSPVSLSGERKDAVAFMQLVGQNGSALEHGIFEELHQNTQGVSAMKIISVAFQQGIPVYQIDSTNSAAILPRLQVSQQTMAEITNAVASGKRVTIPERTIQYYDWVGDGYIIFDPVTGAGGYMISGGLAGGGAAQKDSIFPFAIEQLLSNISFSSLRVVFENIQIGSAVSALRGWYSRAGTLINAIFAGINMTNNTGSAWKGFAAFLGVLGLGLLVTPIILWLTGGVGIGIVCATIAIVAVVTLQMILQTILLEYIATAYLQFRRKKFLAISVNKGVVYAA